MPAKATIRRTLIHAVAALALAACGGGGGGGDPIGPPAANVVGHYAINHTGTITGLPPITCPGELDITSQTGTSFSGTITITANEECQEIAGSGMVSGTVTSTGVLTFTITIMNLEELLESAGCDIIGGDPTFTGSAGASGIIASRTISLRCVIEGGTLETDFEYVISGPRT